MNLKLQQVTFVLLLYVNIFFLRFGHLVLGKRSCKCSPIAMRPFFLFLSKPKNISLHTFQDTHTNIHQDTIIHINRHFLQQYMYTIYYNTVYTNTSSSQILFCIESGFYPSSNSLAFQFVELFHSMCIYYISCLFIK